MYYTKILSLINNNKKFNPIQLSFIKHQFAIPQGDIMTHELHPSKTNSKKTGFSTEVAS